MKKFLSLLLALCMACMMTFAAAEEESAALAATVDLGMNVDADMVLALMGGAEEQADMVNTIVSVLNNLSGHAVITLTGAEGSLNLKDQAVLTLAGAVGEDGVSIVSNLFPSSVIKVSPETLEQMSSSLTGGLNGLDMTSVMEAIIPKLSAIGEKAMSKIGEPQEASFTFANVEFTTWAPLEMTTKEMALLGLNAVKEMLAEPKVAELTARLEGFDASKIDEAIEKVQNTPEEEIPAIKAGVYTTEGGSMAFAAEMGENASNGSMTLAVLEDYRVVMHMAGPNQAGMDFSLDMESGEVAMTMGGDFNGLPMTMGLSGTTSQSGFAGELTIAIVGAPLAVVSIQVAAGGELTAEISAEGRTAIGVSELMGNGESEAAQGLLQEVTTVGLANVISAAAAAMPEEIMALMSLLGAGAR